MNPLVSVNLVFHKDKGFFKPFLDAAENQTYKNIEINIFDGRKENIGFWAGQEKLLEQSNGKYILCLSDVILEKDFLENAIRALEKDERIGAVQGKILRTDRIHIDTTGFKIFRSRRIINRGKGEIDHGQYKEGEVFAVEGAAPVFRKKALEECRMPWLIDPDYRIGPYGYGDDFDLAWRMRLLGWKHWYEPNAVGYHDRSTGGARQNIPVIKRQLDWVNVRFTMIKNEYIINLLKDAPFWITREIGVLFYTVLFEPQVLKAWPRFFKLLPCMMKRRKIMTIRKKSSAEDLRCFYS